MRPGETDRELGVEASGAPPVPITACTPVPTTAAEIPAGWSIAPAIKVEDSTSLPPSENPNRLGVFNQFQVGLKPSPLDVQDIYIESLRRLGLDPHDHDIRFVEPTVTDRVKSSSCSDACSRN